jgi:hypothetical protein
LLINEGLFWRKIDSIKNFKSQIEFFHISGCSRLVSNEFPLRTFGRLKMRTCRIFRRQQKIR